MTVVALHPNTDIKFAGLALIGGSSPATILSDANLGTYVRGLLDNGFCKVHCTTTSLSGGLRIRRARVRIQNAHDSAGATIQTFWLRIYDTQTGKTTAQYSNQRGATNVAQQTGPWEAKAPGGIAWTQTVVDRIGLELALQKSDDDQWMRVHELYLDVDTNSAPIVSGAPVVAGVTSTINPSLSLNYFDADGDLQSRLRYMVYTSAQYSAPGFIAGTSAPAYDSGELFGPIELVEAIPYNHVNNGTYRVYVRVGHDWEGAEGPVWWSSWVASNTYTIAITPPPIPVITITADAALPGYRNAISVLVPINLLTANQSSLETDTVGWTPLGNCTISRSTSYAAHGSASLQMSSTAAGTMTTEMSTRPTVKALETYFVKATMRSATVSRTVRIGIRWYDQAGALIGATVFGSTAASATGADTVPVVSATAPSNALTASVVLEVQATAAAAELHRWDKIGLWVGVDQTWHLGGYQGVSTVLIERLLKVSSDRGDARNWVHAQISSGGGLTKDVDGFTARQNSLLRSTPIDGPHPGGHGSRMIVWHPLIGAFNALDIGLPQGTTTDDPTPPYLVPATPGRAQTVSIYLRGSVAVNARIFIFPVDAFNTQVGSGTEVVSPTVVLPTAVNIWTRYVATITAPAGTTYLRSAVELPSGNADLDVFITGIQYEPGTAATDFVPGFGEWLPAWEPVRELETTVPASPGERLTTHDHEAPPGRPVLYRARTVSGTTASNPSTVVAAYLQPPAHDLLKEPLQPENAVVVGLSRKWTTTRPADLKVYQPIGRDAVSLGTADPVVYRNWLGGKDWAGYFCVSSEDALTQLEYIVKPGNTLLLQHHEGGQQYVAVVEDVTTARLTDGIYNMPVKTLQKRRPI